jgi:hypothetical protein
MHVTRRHLLPALASLMLAFGLASTAAAAGTSGPAPSTAPAFDDSAAPAGAGYVVLRELLASGLLPDGARAAIARLVGEQAEVVHPGFACRRIAQDPDADPELVERCREQAQGGGAATAPGQICRRVAQDPSAHPEYAERCREWIASHDQGSGSSAAQACRRVAQAHPDVSEDLVQRCREWLASFDSDGPGRGEICRRLIAGGGVPEDLVEMCRRLAGDPPARPDADAGLLCRRVAQDADADPALVERCRAWAAGETTDRPRVREVDPERRGEVLRARPAAGADTAADDTE